MGLSVASNAILVGLAVFLVAAVATLVRAAALSRRRGWEVGRDDERRTLLLEEKERALQALKDIELDYSLRKLDDRDYADLRAVQEQRALAANRALRELEAASSPASSRSKRASGFTKVLFPGFLTLWCGVAGGGEACAEGVGTPLPVAAHAAGETIEVDALRLDATGAMVPLRDAWVAVQVVEGTGEGEPRKAVQTVMVRTDAKGSAVATGIDRSRGTSVVVSTMVDGHPFTSDVADGDTRAVVVAYGVTKSLDALSARVQAQLAVDEGVLRVQCDIAFVNAGPRAIEVGLSSPPVLLPIVVPAVGSQAIVAGWMPEQASKHIQSLVEPSRGLVEWGQGTLVYRGLILPGDTTRVRLAYPLTPPDSNVSLAVATDVVRIDEVAVVVKWGARLALSVVGHGQTWGSRVEQGADTIQVVRWVGHVDGARPALLDIRGLPVEGAVRRPVALLGMSALLFGFVVALMRARVQGI